MALKIVTFPDGKSFSNRSADDVTDPDETGLADGGHDPGLLTLIEKTIEQTAEAVASGATASGAADTATAAAGTATTQAGIATTQAGIATTKAAEAAASAAAAAGAVNGVKVSSDDSTPGHLETKLLAGDGLVASTQNPGGAETRTFAVDPDLVLASPTVSTLLTVAAGMQSRGLPLGDVSGAVVIEASGAMDVYCTFTGDTTFLIAGGTEPFCGHQHLIHWTMGGAGGYAVTALPANLLVDSSALAGAGWGTDLVVTSNSAAGADGSSNTADTVEDDNAAAFEQISQSVAASGSTTYCLSWHIRKTVGATVFPNVRLVLSGGATLSYGVDLDTNDGTVAQGWNSAAVLALGAIDAGDYWRVYVAGTSHSGGNTAAVLMYPAFTTAIGVTENATLTGSVVAWGAMLNEGSSPLGYTAVGATRAGQVFWQGTPTDFPAIAAAGTGDLAISIEPDGRIVIQDHTVEAL